VDGIYSGFFGSPKKLGCREGTQEMFLPLTPAMVILIAVMIRWAINDHGTVESRSTKQRFEGKDLSCTWKDG
jgi:hypothetical protein